MDGKGQQRAARVVGQRERVHDDVAAPAGQSMQPLVAGWKRLHCVDVPLGADLDRHDVRVDATVGAHVDANLARPDHVLDQPPGDVVPEAQLQCAQAHAQAGVDVANGPLESVHCPTWAPVSESRTQPQRPGQRVLWRRPPVPAERHFECRTGSGRAMTGGEPGSAPRVTRRRSVPVRHQDGRADLREGAVGGRDAMLGLSRCTRRRCKAQFSPDVARSNRACRRAAGYWLGGGGRR